MPLSKKEKNYIRKNIETDSNLDLEIIIDVMNKKRDPENQLEVEDLSEYIESLSSNEKSSDRHLKKAKEMKKYKDLEALISDTTNITAGVIENLLPALIEDTLNLQKPKDYTIVKAAVTEGLEQDVKKMMAIGWIPFGGVGVDRAGMGGVALGQMTFFQAMVKLEEVN